MSRHSARVPAGLLKSVSRTFYLTLKVLPAPVRGPLSLGYLLARAADTLADTATVPAGERLGFLDRFSALLAGEPGGQSGTAGFVRHLEDDFVPRQENAAEADLLRAIPGLLDSLRGMPPFEQAATRDVLAEILVGQREDLEHFPADGTIRALPDGDALDRYTYLVAGSVGAFWTRLGFHAYGERYANLPPEEMEADGIRLGKGLQLINVLRDLPEDLAAGRCYLPADLLGAAGIRFPLPAPTEKADLRDLFARLRPAAMDWLRTCRDNLDRGAAYAENVRNRRLRFATALPLNLAARTARLLENSSDESWLNRVKISRAEVKSVAKKTSLCLISRKAVQKLYGEFSS